jgi:hypothetical protein
MSHILPFGSLSRHPRPATARVAAVLEAGLAALVTVAHGPARSMYLIVPESAADAATRRFAVESVATGTTCHVRVTRRRVACDCGSTARRCPHAVAVVHLLAR